MSEAVPAQPRRVLGGGQVLLEVTVSPTGRVADLTELRTTPPFTRSVIDVVRDWQFSPAEETQADGQSKPVESRVLVAAIFRPPTLRNVPRPGQPPQDVRPASQEVPFPMVIAVPLYPPRALFEGIVLMEVAVDRDGTVQETTILRSGAGFDQAAIQAARQWRFRPALREGNPTTAIAYIVFGFRQPVLAPRKLLGDAVEEFYGERPDAHRADVDVNSTARALVGTYPEAPFRPATEEGI
ncbi:MAG: TonB family protein [Gemmatimonadales bacterium]